jgi:tetratricopeptide (TPR) repeat protein
MQNEETERLIKRAEEYKKKGMYSEAITELQKLISIHPDSLPAHRCLAETYCRQREIDRAVTEYQNILNLDPNDRESQTMLASLQSLKEQERTAQTGNEGVPVEQTGEQGVTPDIRALEEEEHNTDRRENIPVYEIQNDMDGSDIGIEIPGKLDPVKEGTPSKELEEYRKIVEEHAQDSPLQEDMQKPGKKPGSHDSYNTQGDTDAADKGSAHQHQHGSPEDDRIVISMPTQTMADICVSQELYEKAMDIYNEMLAADPENKTLLQRREELKMLIRIKNKK